MNNNQEFDRSVAFTFYAEWAEDAATIEEDYGAEGKAMFYDAIIYYALNEVEIEATKKPPIKYFWAALKEKIDASQSHRAKGFAKEDTELTRKIIGYKNDNPDASQREIADALNCSVGKVNKSLKNNSTDIPTDIIIPTDIPTTTTVNVNVNAHESQKEDEQKESKNSYIKSLLEKMDCSQLSEIRQLYENGTKYKDIASKYNIPYFNAAEFVEIYEDIYKEQYDMEHPEEKAAREQREREHREFERREREEEEAFLKHLRGLQQNKHNKSTPTEQKRVTEQAIMIDGSLIDSRLRGHLFPEDTVNKIQSGEIDKNDLISLFVEYDSTNDEEAQNCGSLKFLNQG